MNTAMMAILSALSVAGVGTAAVAGSSMQMTGNGMMGGGMHNGNGSMHGGMHGDCPCCDLDDTGNDTAGGGQSQLTFGP